MTNVAMPVLSSLKDQTERYAKYYQRFLDIVASLAMPLMLYCFIEAEFLIKLLLGRQWLGAIPVFRILAIAGLLQPVSSTTGLVMVSFGYTKRYLYYGSFVAIVYIVAIVVGLRFGIEGVAIGYAIVEYGMLLPSLCICFHKTPVTVALFLKSVSFSLLNSVMAMLAFLLMRRFLGSDSYMSHLVSLVVFIGIYIGISFCRSSIRESILIIFKSLKTENTITESFN